MYNEELDNGYYHRDARDEEAQERAVRLNALCRVYEQGDRVLTGDPVVVNVMPDGPAPAWSDGAAIYINLDQIEDMDLETLTQVTGLNYHELSHHLYSPRKGTTFMQWVVENGQIQSANILEDQRIETLFVARYPAVASYLTAMVSRWLGRDEDGMRGNYICIRGRRYLPVEIRQAFRDEFAFPHVIPAAVDIIDQYRLLAFPRDYDKGKELIERFTNEVLIPMGIKDDHTHQGGPNGCGQRMPVGKGRPETGKAQEKDSDRAKGMGTAETPWYPKPKPAPTQTHPGGCGTPTDKADDADGNGNSDKPADGAPLQPTTPEQALDLRDKGVNQTPQTTPGSGHVDSVGGIPKNINDMLNTAIDNVLARKDVQADIKAKQKVIVGGDGKHDDITKKGKFDNTSVPSESIVAYRKFAQELQRLRDDMEPTWEKETPTGRLNVQRVIRGCEIDAAFDRWDEGDDGCDIEAVILVDRSGSMSSQQNDKKASIACWTIKRALESIQAPVTVYAFDDSAEVAYSRKELADKTQYKFIYGNGGTEPYPTLLVAEQLLMSSRKKNKMLFIVTDGVFDAQKNDAIIERIGKRGILTAMTLIMNDSDYNYYVDDRGQDPKQFQHGAEVFARISNASDLLPFAKQVVTSAIKKRGRR